MLKKGKSIFIIVILAIIVSFFITKIYFNFNLKKFNLTTEEKKWIESNTILIAPDPNLYPIEFRDSDCKYKGLSADYFDLIAKKTGLKYEVVWYNNWNEIYTALKNKEVHISTFIVASEDREQDLYFTEKYFGIDTVIIAKENSEYNNIESLKQKKIGVIKDYITLDYLSKDEKYNFEIVELENIDDLFLKLKSGEIDAVANDIITIYTNVEKNNINDIKIISKYGERYNAAMGIVKGEEILFNIINKAIKSISKNEKNKIQSKWFGELYSKNSFYEYRFMVISFTVILIILSLILFLWNNVLKLEVNKKTKELRIISRFFTDSKEGMFVIDHNGKIVNVNNAFVEITGFNLNDIEGKNHAILKSKKTDIVNYKEKIEKEILEKGKWEGEVWLNKKSGEDFVAWLSAIAIKNDKENITNFIGIIEDLTSHKQKQENISWLSNYDTTTGLPNQMLFRDRLSQTTKKYEFTKKRFALVYIDINNFKFINENLGYEKGDMVLFMVSERLKNIISPAYTLSRISGDHFLLLIPYFDSLKELEETSKKLLMGFNEKFIFDEKEFFINLSLGIAIYPEDLDGNESIINSAFKALKHSKKLGKNSYQFYSNELSSNIKEKLKMDAALREAIKNNELYLNYQPQLDLKTGEIVGMEALVRWKNPEFGIVSPMIFIPLAEENGMILKIGEWVLSKACEDIKTILKLGYNIRVSVNLSPTQFKQINLLNVIQDTLKKWGIPPYFIELEITEGIFLDNVKRNIYILNEIRNMSIKIALDDFGTGYSSLSYLQNFKFDRLKLDQSFVRNMDKNENRKICETIIDLAHKLGLKAIAEGVETEEHFDFLKDKRCDEIQGYYFSRPIMFDDVLELIKKTNEIKEKKS